MRIRFAAFSELSAKTPTYINVDTRAEPPEPQPIKKTAPLVIDEERRIAPSDVALMRRVRATGDPKAFAVLAGRYRTPLRRFFVSLLPEAASQADDLAQETLLRLWLLRDRYESTGVFSAFVFRIARNLYLNQRERYQGQAVRETSAETGGRDGEAFDVAETTGTSSPEAVLLTGWERERLRRAVGQLSEAHRRVWELRHDDGLAYAEIAERAGVPLGTVKSRLSEAARRLRQILENEERNEQ